MCYAVSSNVPNSSLADVSHPSWLVLANACTGQVLARVEQTACNTCPSTTTLSVDVHAMTFSRITGELLVSTSTAYKVCELLFANYNVRSENETRIYGHSPSPPGNRRDDGFVENVISYYSITIACTNLGPFGFLTYPARLPTTIRTFFVRYV